MPFWRGRDHEAYIGGYDPEHEMPNPDRDPRERYMSEAYRRNSHDSRFAYRHDPDRFEQRMGPRERPPVPSARDHYERGFAHGREWGRREAEMELYRRQHSGPYDRNVEREFDRGYNVDFDYERDRNRRY